MFNKVLVANRGAVAVRVIRALEELGVHSVAVYSDADRDGPWLDMAGQAYRLGEAAAKESYLNQDAILAVMKETGCDAVHPGYGFLSENHGFAANVIDRGHVFIGPSPKWIEAMGHKTRARDLAAQHGLPVGRGSGVVSRETGAVLEAARRIGFPILVKPAAGGGGIGMLAARNEEELLSAVERAASMAERGFANAEVYLERLIERPRHVEIQVLGDRDGKVTHLFERDCSIQRRHQKVIEEAPGPLIPRELVEPLAARVAETMSNIGYDNIGTIEMLMDADGEFSFLEMNTRLQVEHGVTEEVTGVDLVQAQVRSAAGQKLAEVLPKTPKITGHAIQARVYAEDPKRFFPSPGKLKTYRPPETGVRVETGYREGQDVTPHYDPMVAKVIAHGKDRRDAISKLREALGDFVVEGIKTNIPALDAMLASEEFAKGEVHTGLLGEVIARNK